MDGMNWRTASYTSNGEACVEVASAGAVLIRDTTDRGGAMLRVPAAAWIAFIATLT
jgi:Domain of unknown function (DUF397)